MIFLSFNSSACIFMLCSYIIMDVLPRQSTLLKMMCHITHLGVSTLLFIFYTSGRLNFTY